VMPFDNSVATLDVTGEQLQRLLAAAYGSKKGVFQVSGLELQLGRCPSPDRLRAVRLPKGKSLDPTARYRVAMPDFLARGGDGLGPVLATIDPSRVDLGDGRGANLRDELVAFWQARKERFAAPAAGRVTILAGGDPCTPPVRPEQTTAGP
jgi:5'-nucleotidase